MLTDLQTIFSFTIFHYLESLCLRTASNPRTETADNLENPQTFEEAPHAAVRPLEGEGETSPDNLSPEHTPVRDIDMEDISTSSEEDKEAFADDEGEPDTTHERMTQAKASSAKLNERGITQPFGTIASHVVDSNETPPIISSDKLIELKSKSPADFLKVILKMKGNLTSMDGNSSTSSGGIVNETTARDLLRQIRARIFDVDLYGILPMPLNF